MRNPTTNPPPTPPIRRPLQVMELVELDRLRNAYVGVLGAHGLSLEQRKRLTIACELVANPSILFLDVSSGLVCGSWQLVSGLVMIDCILNNAVERVVNPSILFRDVSGGWLGVCLWSWGGGIGWCGILQMPPLDADTLFTGTKQRCVITRCAEHS